MPASVTKRFPLCSRNHFFLLANLQASQQASPSGRPALSSARERSLSEIFAVPDHNAEVRGGPSVAVETAEGGADNLSITHNGLTLVLPPGEVMFLKTILAVLPIVTVATRLAIDGYSGYSGARPARGVFHVPSRT